VTREHKFEVAEDKKLDMRRRAIGQPDRVEVLERPHLVYSRRGRSARQCQPGTPLEGM